MEIALLLIGGLVILVIGGELLVKGSAALALRFNISAIIIGLTVVAFGTSAPELVVSLEAAFKGKPDISVGNIIGSNLCNIGLILGLVALISPVPVHRDFPKVNWPVMFFAAVLLTFFVWDLKLVFWEGAVFIIVLIAFISWLVRRVRKEGKEMVTVALGIEEPDEEGLPLYKIIFFLIIGSAGLVFGADWFIDGSIRIAKAYGVSDRVIGLSLVALGTSLPELFASLVAAYRKKTEIAIGNLMGSNILNIFLILGLTSMIHPLDVSISVIDFDIYWLLGISLILLPLMLIRKKMGWWEGLILVGIYAAYMWMIF